MELARNFNKRNAVILVDINSSGLSYFDIAKERGYIVIGVFVMPRKIYESLPPGFTPPYLHDKTYFDNEFWLEDDGIGFSELKQAIDDLGLNICGVFAGTDPGIELADTLAKEYGTPGNSPETSSARRDKLRMKTLVAASGLRTPKFSCCKSEEDIYNFCHTAQLPIVVKTPTGSGSKNVYICQSLDAAIKAHQIITASNDFTSLNTPSFSLCEEFIQGIEYIVNLFGNGEKVIVTDIWRYQKTKNSGTADLYQDTILEDLNDPRFAKLKKYALELAHAVGAITGPSHAEIMIDDKGPILVEIASRFCGIKAPLMVKEFSNFDPINSAFDIFTGKSVHFPQKIKFKKKLWITTPHLKESGRVKNIWGVSKIKKLSSFHSGFFPLKKGDTASATDNLFTIPCNVWLAANSVETLTKEAAIVHKSFRVETE